MLSGPIVSEPVEDSNLADSALLTDSQFFLFPLNRDVHDVALALHEQEGEVGGFEGIGEALQYPETVHVLSVQFQYDVARLQAGGFSEAPFFNIRDHNPITHRQIHLACERWRHIIEDHAR